MLVLYGSIPSVAVEIEKVPEDEAVTAVLFEIAIFKWEPSAQDRTVCMVLSENVDEVAVALFLSATRVVDPIPLRFAGQNVDTLVS